MASYNFMLTIHVIMLMNKELYTVHEDEIMIKFVSLYEKNPAIVCFGASLY